MTEELKEEVEVPGGAGEVVKKKRVKHGGRQKTYLTPEALQEHIREYARNYYHTKVKKELCCQYCDTPFTNQSNYSRHLRNSQTCKRIKEKMSKLFDERKDRLNTEAEANDV